LFNPHNPNAPTVPASSAIAERSFSCLRQFRTYLKSTVSQSRLNQEKVDDLDPNPIQHEFVAKNKLRRKSFGKIAFLVSDRVYGGG